VRIDEILQVMFGIFSLCIIHTQILK
jgi:hypothetical protein